MLDLVTPFPGPVMSHVFSWRLKRTAAEFASSWVAVKTTDRAMSRSGAVDLKAIADVTGHSYSSIETIYAHYLGRDARRRQGDRHAGGVHH